MKIHGIAGNFIVKLKGTRQFDLKEDDGVKRTVEIPNTLYYKGVL